MKSMTMVFLALSILFISWGAMAHQPDLSSTILVEQGENKWMLQIRGALTAFEYVIEKHFGESAYASPEEFQELVINYLQENISVHFNKSNAAVLQNGMVKLGHETSVTFEVTGTPKTIRYLEVTNSSFRDIPRNQSTLMVLKEGFSKEKFILNIDNQHNVKLKAGNARFELAAPTREKTQYFLLVFALIFLVASLVAYFIYKGTLAKQFPPVSLNVW